MVLQVPSCCALPFGFEVGLSLCGGWTRCPPGIPSKPNHSLILRFPLRRYRGSGISKGYISWSELFIGGCPKINRFRDQKLFWNCAENFQIWVKLTVFMIIPDYSMILFASADGSIIFYAVLYAWKKSLDHFSYHFFFLIFIEVLCKELFPPEPPNIVTGK